MTALIQNLIEEDYGYEVGAGRWGRSLEHDSLVLNEETQQWFWNSRGIRGNLRDYLTKVRGYSNEQASKFISDSSNIYISSDVSMEEQVPPYEKLVDLMWSSGKKNRDYWYKRCLTDNTIDMFRLGYFDGWNLIPMYEGGVFKNFQCRKDVPDKRIKQWYKHGTPTLFNGDILQFVSTVYMTEGTVDAMLLTQLGFPTVSQCGTNIWRDEWFSKFSKITRIYYIEDHDKAGRTASKLISSKLGYDRVKILSYDTEIDKFDTVDFFRSGNTIDDFKGLLENNTRFIYELEDVNVKKHSRRY